MPPLYDNVADAHEISGSGTIVLDTVGATSENNEASFGDGDGVWLKIDGSIALDGFTLVLNCSTVSGAIVPYVDVYRVSASFNPASPDFRTFGAGGTIHYLTGPDAYYDGSLLGTQYLGIDFTNPNHQSDGDIYYLWCGDWNGTDQGEISITYQIIASTEVYASIVANDGEDAYIEAAISPPELDTYVEATIGFTTAGKAALEASGGHTGSLIRLFRGNPFTNLYLRADGNTPGQLEWWLRIRNSGVDTEVFITAAHTEPDEFHTIDIRRTFNVGIQVRIDGTDYGIVDTTNVVGISTDDLSFGQLNMPLDTNQSGTIYFNSIAVGTTGFGSGDLFSESFGTGAFADPPWDTKAVSGDSFNALLGDPFSLPPTPPADPIYSGPAVPPSLERHWRFIVTDLYGTTLTWLDHWCKDRAVIARLNAPWEASGSVPSDSPEINILAEVPFTLVSHPFLNEGTRLLYCFRRESDFVASGDHPWVCRFAGTILDTQDASDSGPARTAFTAYDPWQYLYNLPVKHPNTGALLGPDGVNFSAKPGSLIALEILIAATQSADDIGTAKIDMPTEVTMPEIPGSTGSGLWEANPVNVIEDTDVITLWNVQQGKSVGEAWDDLVATGTMDIVLRPVYDPRLRPGILSEISIYARAGQNRPNAVMAWDKPVRSLVGINREDDGTQRANVLRFMSGQGGPPDAELDDFTSIDIYREYWLQQFYPDKVKPGQVATQAERQLDELKDGLLTLQVTPASERSAIPFLEYEVGDRVPVYASMDFRAELAGAFRVTEIPINISDNGVESVQTMTVIPDGELTGS